MARHGRIIILVSCFADLGSKHTRQTRGLCPRRKKRCIQTALLFPFKSCTPGTARSQTRLNFYSTSFLHPRSIQTLLHTYHKTRNLSRSIGNPRTNARKANTKILPSLLRYQNLHVRKNDIPTSPMK